MKKKTVITSLIIVLLLVATFGISVAFFSYQKNGLKTTEIVVGDITFKYTENNKKGNGINIEDATPISDSEGKKLNDYFEFTVDSKLSKSDLKYEVVVEPTEDTTMNLSGVKFYLTEVDGNNEKIPSTLDSNGNEVTLVSSIKENGKVKALSEYNNTEIVNATGKTVYQEIIQRNTKNYTKTFRARIWIDEDIDWTDEGYINTIASFKVNVYANIDMPSNSQFASVPGLYDENNQLIKSWPELEALGLTKQSIETNYTADNYQTEEGSPYKVFTDNELSGKLKLPSDITKIGANSFRGTAITAIDIPDSVTSFGNYAFAETSSLKSALLPSNMTKISYSMFWKSGLESINIPDGVTTIGDYAFSRCSSLKSVEIPNSVISIGNSGFWGTGLTSIEIPDSVTSIGEYIFSTCADLKTVKLSKNITTIPKSAFNTNTSLESINIPNGVTTIGDYAFYSSGIKSIEIPDSVTTIGERTFSNCSNLSSVDLSDNLEIVGANSFSYIPIESLDIPDSVTTIGDYAFYNCNKLSTIKLSNNLESIGKSVFYQNTSLEAIEIPDSVSEIGAYAFNRSGLKTITIPSEVTSIGKYAFYSSNITSAIFEDNVDWYALDSDTDTMKANLILTDSSANATYLKTTYSSDHWKKRKIDFSSASLLNEMVLSKNTIVETDPDLTTTSEDSGEKGLYSMTTTTGFGGNGNTTYYFRGKVDSNIVDFAGLTWRIIRINEDGTVRLILEQAINNNEKYKFSSSYDDYIYMYYSNSVNGVKKVVDDWYNETIGNNSSYSSKIALGNYFCEAAKVVFYSTYTANNANVQLWDEHVPDLNCTSDDGNGKGYVSAPAGLITYDEVRLAGGTPYKTNKSNYLYRTSVDGVINDYYWWTMSPAGYRYDANANAWYIHSKGVLTNDSVNNTMAVRPVINLKADTLAIYDNITGHYIVKEN